MNPPEKPMTLNTLILAEIRLNISDTKATVTAQVSGTVLQK